MCLKTSIHVPSTTSQHDTLRVQMTNMLNAQNEYSISYESHFFTLQLIFNWSYNYFEYRHHSSQDQHLPSDTKKKKPRLPRWQDMTQTGLVALSLAKPAYSHDLHLTAGVARGNVVAVAFDSQSSRDICIVNQVRFRRILSTKTKHCICNKEESVQRASQTQNNRTHPGSTVTPF